jgi:hypothetical protein
LEFGGRMPVCWSNEEPPQLKTSEHLQSGELYSQYEDELRGDDLYIDGQLSSFKDKIVIEHEAGGLEVLLFYRESKSEHRGAAFRYEGNFRYIDHRGARPAKFHLRRIAR